MRMQMGNQLNVESLQWVSWAEYGTVCTAGIKEVKVQLGRSIWCFYNRKLFYKITGLDESNHWTRWRSDKEMPPVRTIAMQYPFECKDCPGYASVNVGGFVRQIYVPLHTKVLRSHANSQIRCVHTDEQLTQPVLHLMVRLREMRIEENVDMEDNV